MDEMVLKDRLSGFFSELVGYECQVVSVKPLAGGACQDNLVVGVEWWGPGAVTQDRFVVRSDAPRPLQGSLRREQEFSVISAAVAAGVRTPGVRLWAMDVVRNGASALVMEWVDGTAIGKRVVSSAELAGARARLASDLVDELVKIGEIRPEAYPELIAVLGKPPVDSAAQVLTQLQESVAAFVEPHPALDLVIRWLWDHKPPPDEVVLVHGDFRVGNFMVNPEGLVAILDWEFAHWGSRYEDMGWISVRDWRFGRLQLPVGGFSDRNTFVAAYEKASGKAVDPRTVLYWEVVGNVRWAVGCVQQGERYLSGEQRDIEFLAIMLRTAEMEFEALRLIERLENAAST